MNKLQKVKKGDTIFIANTDRRQYHHKEYNAVVVSVGSKWITIEGGQKFSLEGSGEYGYYAYASRDVYTAIIEANEAWQAFLAEFRTHSAPASVDRIRRAAALLRGEDDATSSVGSDA
jgi:hypothetical protein